MRLAHTFVGTTTITFIYAVLVFVGAALGEGPGWVYPEKIEAQIGSNFNISCTKNQTFFIESKNKYSCDINDMHFVITTKNGGELYKLNTTDSRIFKYNETTIVLMTKNAASEDLIYRCMCEKNAINNLHVSVGTYPLKVNDFQCHGYDFDYMICNFTKPNNTIATKYNLSYARKDNISYRYYNICNSEHHQPSASDYDYDDNFVCNITGETYKNKYQYFVFRLDIENSLGKISQTINVNNLENMIPSRPGEKFHINKITKNNACFQWHMRKLTFYVKPGLGLQWQIQVQPENFTDIENLSYRTPVAVSNFNTLELCIDDLPYAGYKYQLRIRVRVAAADSIWSEQFVYDFETEMHEPERSPRVTPGSFYMYSSETQLRLYWEELERHEYNGDNFGYVISEYRKNGKIMNSSSIEVESNSAIIKNWQKNAHYEIYIRSRNRKNVSMVPSRMEILPITDAEQNTHKPLFVQNAYHPNNNSYTLKWEPPKNQIDLLSYTVYWCWSKRALQNECEGSIHFKNISRDARSFNSYPSQNRRLNIAISANYKKFNTGMHWPECTLDVTSDLTKMEPTIDDITATTLIVKWSTGRVCPVILTGYNLTYCEDVTGANDCITVPIDNNRKSYEIQNLKPYTNYKVKMLMYSKNKTSNYSAYLRNRTSEAAPTPPRELKWDKLTNTSATISWMPPSVTNGRIRSYIITLSGNNNPEIIIDVNQTQAEQPMSHILDDLTSYTGYKVYVKAKTIHISEPSNDIYFKTAVGVPPPPVLDQKEKNTLTWKAPDIPAGGLEYYEVLIREYDSSNNNNTQTPIKQHLSYIMSKQNLTCIISPHECISSHYFSYQVRAVNVEAITNATETNIDANSEQDDFENFDSDELICKPVIQLNAEQSAQLKSYTNKKLYRHFYSEWAANNIYCSLDTSEHLVTSIALMILMVSCASTVSHFGYKKVKKMSLIECKLPIGLDHLCTKTTESKSPSASSASTCVITVHHETNESDQLLTKVNTSTPFVGHCIDTDHCGFDGVGQNAAAADPNYIRMHSATTVDTMLNDDDVKDADNYEDDNNDDDDVYDNETTTTRAPNTTDYVNGSVYNNNHNGNEHYVAVPSSRNVCIGYIKPTNMMSWPITTLAATITTTTVAATANPPALSSYVTVQSLQKPLTSSVPPAATSVVAPIVAAALPPASAATPMFNNGYITAAAVQKLTMPTRITMNPIATTAAAAIPNSRTATSVAQLAMPTSLLQQPHSFTANCITQQQQQQQETGQLNNSVPVNGGETVAATANANACMQTGTAATPTAQQQQQQQNRQISGYVTQQDLNVFGKQQRNQDIQQPQPQLF